MEIEHAGQPRFIFHGDCLSSVFETQHICEPAHRTLRERKAFHARYPTTTWRPNRTGPGILAGLPFAAWILWWLVPSVVLTMPRLTWPRPLQGAHLILNRRGPDTDVKRWGLKLAAHGGKNAKKRAIVAVARKLAVLLHRWWVTGAV
jgi:hypothetical protein